MIRWSEYHKHSSSSSIHSNPNNDIEVNTRGTVSQVVTCEPNTVNCFLTPSCEKSYFDKEIRRNNRITIFLITLTVIFGISWLPWNLFNIY
ncbi:unnamed protein product, partial [Oppiella nova]